MKKPISYVAEWNVLIIDEPSDKSLVSFQQHLLAAIIEIAEIFEEQELFELTEVSLNSWTFFDVESTTYKLTTYPSRVIARKDLTKQKLFSIYEQEVKEASKLHFDTAPFEIICTGKGKVILSNGESSYVDNLIYFVGNLFIESTITIYVTTDIWLPNKLNGEPQPMIYKYNSQRLSKVLKKIDSMDKFDFYVSNSFTKYAVNDGFTLTNL